MFLTGRWVSVIGLTFLSHLFLLPKGTVLQPPSVSLLIMRRMKYAQRGQGLHLLTELLLGLAVLQCRRFAGGVVAPSWG